MAGTASTAASAASSAASNLNVASSIVDMGLGIATTIAGISDMNKRRRFEESLALLSNRQKQDLNEKLLAAQTQTDRLAILSGSVVDYAIANENSASRKETTMYIIAGCLAAVILTAAIIYAVKKKKK